MSLISKQPEKAKYRITSTDENDHYKYEVCDNKDQVAAYLRGLASDRRTEITLWTRTPLPKLSVKKPTKQKY